MKNLLLKIQAELREIDGIRDRDVFLSVDKDLIPNRAKLPCIGVKDGKVGRKDLMGGSTELRLPVEVYVYEKVTTEENAAISILDRAGDVHAALDDNLLGDYVQDVSTGDENPIQVLYRKDGLVLRKELLFTYEREEA